jgi:hypothetical protein
MAEKITIDDLAGMIARGFEQTATKNDLTALRTEMNERFDRVENLLLADHKRRIEKLEAEVKELRNAPAM